VAQTEEFPSKRLISLDAFRGATLALMVLVNDPGDGAFSYGPLQHSEWNGWTITDLVFPSFLWIVGVAMTLSLGGRLAAGVPRATLLLQAARRALIIYVLGLIVYAWPLDFATQRLLGVLQRIAICYLIAAVIYLYCGVRGQLLWLVGLLIVYWLLIMLVPVPGFGAGRLDTEGNLAHYIDRIVLGAHNYHRTKTWDPEGLLSTLPAIATALLGVMAGHMIRWQRHLTERVTWMFVTGNALIALGMICDIWLPINKKLWTSSFSLFVGGLDFVLLAMFIWLVDHLGYQRYVRPFVIMGMNSIAVYMASELGAELLGATGWQQSIYNAVFAPIASPVNASLLYAVAYVLCMYAIAYVMYRKKWFWRV
jgi:predicted acyltransferase